MKKAKKIIKWMGFVLLSLLSILLIAYLFVFISTEKRIHKEYTYVDVPIDVHIDSISIARGKHLYQIRACQDCHGKTLEGSIFINDPLLIRVTAPNLTKGKGGLPNDFNEMDWIRALRHGVDRKGHSLFMMPSNEMYELTDQDIADIIAYCTTQPEVDKNTKKLHTIGPIGRLLMMLDDVVVLPAERIDHSYVPVKNKTEGISSEYGRYLSSGCIGCHRANMEGGGPLAPGFPDVPNITSTGHLANWNENQFLNTIRKGVTPEGHQLDNEFMPWKSISYFTDDELKSIYLYLKSLPTKV